MTALLNISTPVRLRTLHAGFARAAARPRGSEQEPGVAAMRGALGALAGRRACEAGVQGPKAHGSGNIQKGRHDQLFRRVSVESLWKGESQSSLSGNTIAQRKFF